MKKLFVAALAVLVLSGCGKASQESTALAKTETVAEATTTNAAPAPQQTTEVVVSNEEINAGKNVWVAAQAAQHNISVAEVERRARFMRATPGMKVNVCGRSVAFIKTIWHSCEAAIRETRTTQATAAPAAQDPNVVTLTRQQYNLLLAEAYENPEETDPSKLRGFREKAGGLEVQVDNLDGVNLTHWLMFFLGMGIGFVIYKLVFRRKKTNGVKRDYPFEDLRPAPPGSEARTATTPSDFTK